MDNTMMVIIVMVMVGILVLVALWVNYILYTERSQGEELSTEEQKSRANRFIEIFSSPNERLVSVLGSNFAEHFIASGRLKSGFAVLSDKRVYFKDECFTFGGKSLKKSQEERIVDVKDVSGTGFIHASNRACVHSKRGCYDDRGTVGGVL